MISAAFTTRLLFIEFEEDRGLDLDCSNGIMFDSSMAKS